MAVIDATTFIERYASFSDLNEDIITSEIDIASLSFPSTLWQQESIRNKVISLMVAHNLQVEYNLQLRMGSDLRLIEEGKDLNKKEELYKTGEYYQLTPYGKQLLDIIRRVSGAAMFVP